MEKNFKNIVFSKVVRGLMLGFLFFFFASLQSRRHFGGIINFIYGKDIFSALLALTSAIFIGFVIGLSNTNIKRMFIIIIVSIVSGLVVAAISVILIGNRRAEGISGLILPPYSLLLVAPIILIISIDNFIQKSFIQLIVSLTGLLITAMLSPLLIAIGDLLSYGWWGSGKPELIWGEWPMYIACGIAGIIMICGIEIGDFFKRGRLVKNGKK